MKRFRAKFNPKRKGVYSVSLVDEPAMEGDFIQFAKENPLKFASVDESKRRVMGLILEPDKDILRYDAENNTHYTVHFEKQDIEDVAYNFQKQGNQNNSTIQHQGKQIEGVSFVETWIVENPKVDKSTNFGFEYPKGSWIGVMELENEEIWNDYVKTGKVKGFSIDALMEFEEINLNKLNMSEIKESSILDAIKKGFAQLAENPFAKKKDEKDMTPEEIEKAKKLAEKVKAEKDGKKKEDEEEKVKMAKIEADKLALEAVKDGTKIEFNSEDFIKSMISELKTILEPTEVALAKLEKDVLEFKKENETLKTKNLELSKLPATKSVKAAPRQISFSEMSNYEKFQYNKEN